MNLKDYRYYYFLHEGESTVRIPGTCLYCNQVFEDLRNHLIIRKIKVITQDFPKFNCDTCQLILTTAYMRQLNLPPLI